MMRAQLCFFIAFFFFPASGFSVDLETLIRECDSCHGLQGASSESDVPIIGGQGAKYIAESLALYQQWGRPCTKSAYRHGDTSRPVTTMCTIAAGLGFDEIEALGQHYAQQEFLAAKQEFDQAKASAGAVIHEKYCFSCHPDNGSTPGLGPRLAGQWADYLKSAVDQALSGEHLVPPIMEHQLLEFSDEEIDALVNLYASQQ
jgi:sulfide dehydrogenase cytochrome subunit